MLFCTGMAARSQTPLPFLLDNGRFQYQHAAGTPAFNTSFETATPFQNGLAVVSDKHSYQLINTSGQVLSEAQWTEISPAPDGYFLAFSSNKKYALLRNGKNVFESEARLIGAPSPQGWIPFQQPATGQAGILQIHTGKELASARFDHIRPFSGKITAAFGENTWKFIDSAGRPVSAHRYEGAAAFSDGLAAVRREGKWGFVNEKENWVIAAQYDRVTDFRNGTAFAQTGESWKQIDPTGNVLRELPYQMVITPAEGLYAFMQANLWGFASAETGKVVIVPQYLRAAAFENGLAFVVKDGQQFYIQRDGTELRVVK